MKTKYKLAIMAPLAAATAAGLIAASGPAKRNYDTFHLDEHVRTEEIRYRVDDAHATLDDLYETAENRIENGVLAARYGNTSNLGDITFAGVAIAGIAAGLAGLVRKLTKKGENN